MASFWWKAPCGLANDTEKPALSFRDGPSAFTLSRSKEKTAYHHQHNNLRLHAQIQPLLCFCSTRDKISPLLVSTLPTRRVPPLTLTRTIAIEKSRAYVGLWWTLIERPDKKLIAVTHMSQPIFNFHDSRLVVFFTGTVCKKILSSMMSCATISVSSGRSRWLGGSHNDLMITSVVVC